MITSNKILLIVLIVLVILNNCWFTIHMHSVIEKNIQLKETQNKTIDSLNNELLIYQIDNGRYEMILDNIWQKDSNIVINASKNVE